MGKQRKTKEEILEKRRLAAHRRQQKIKTDPFLHQKQKEKNKERYNRRKQEKKIIPVSEMTEKDRMKARQRNRDNYRAYYRRKKSKQQLETVEEEELIDSKEPDSHIKKGNRDNYRTYYRKKEDEHLFETIEEEELIDTKEPESHIKDPLNIHAHSSYSLRSSQRGKSLVQHICTTDLKDVHPPQATTSIRVKCNTTLTNDTLEASDCMTVSPKASRSLSASPLNTEQIQSDQDSSSCTTPISNFSVCSRTSFEKSKRPLNSPSLIFKRYKYKVQKEMALMRRKIEELKKDKEKLRREVLRLKAVHILPKRPFQNPKKAVSKNISSGSTKLKIEQDFET